MRNDVAWYPVRDLVMRTLLWLIVLLSFWRKKQAIPAVFFYVNVFVGSAALSERLVCFVLG
jgi:hypothetical protein